MTSVTMTPRIYGFTGNVQSFATRFGPDPFIRSYLNSIITRSSDDIVLASLKLLFPSPIILLFSVLLVSHDQLCYAKN